MGDGEKMERLLPGRNLIVCADGTGNTAGRANGTNVWRVYDALAHDGERDDPLRPVQLAVHDDGVGTDGNSLLRALGGVFGLGLASKLRHLYAWLIQNYERGNEGRDADQIYLFGFSRGAFTVRCLAGMIAHYGLPEPGKGESPSDVSMRAWVSYKRSLQPYSRKPEAPDHDEVKIRFLGVWDTVDAYGFPVDEVKEGMAFGSQLLFRGPLARFAWTRFNDNRPSPVIENVRHAIALDDERHTFHPEVFDESPHPTDKRSPNILQLWFAGMHADVGGGYPRDSLAHTSLLWMMNEATAARIRVDENSEVRRPATHLRFSEKQSDYEHTANALGQIHDSRSGPRFFFRYRPRDAFALCNSHKAKAGVPRVHHSVPERIASTNSQYLPQGLSRFSVWNDGGEEEQVAIPETSRDDVRDVQFKRRLLYVATLVWTLLFAFFPLIREAIFGPRPNDWVQPGWGSFGLGHAMSALQEALPALLGAWLTAMRKEPFYFILFLSGFLFLRLLRSDLLVATRQMTERAWKCRRVLNDEEAEEWKDERPPESVVSVFRRKMLPGIVAACLVAMAILLTVGGRWDLSLPVQDRSSTELAQPLRAEELDFELSSPATTTEFYVEKGKQYQVTIEPNGPWFDAGIPIDPETGIDSPPGLLRASALFKRKLRHPWGRLLQAVGSPLGEVTPVTSGKKWIAPRTGRLSFFVNDATCYLCPGGPWVFYENNRGSAKIRVKALEQNE